MYRDLRKYIAEYDGFRKRNKYGNKHAFYNSDLDQIIDLGKGDAGIALNALKAGFVIGYRAGKRETQKRAV